MHANHFLPLAYTNFQFLSLRLIGAPSSNPLHPLCPDLFHGSTTTVFSIDHS